MCHLPVEGRTVIPILQMRNWGTERSIVLPNVMQVEEVGWEPTFFWPQTTLQPSSIQSRRGGLFQILFLEG